MQKGRTISSSIGILRQKAMNKKKTLNRALTILGEIEKRDCICSVGYKLLFFFYCENVQRSIISLKNDCIAWSGCYAVCLLHIIIWCIQKANETHKKRKKKRRNRHTNKEYNIRWKSYLTLLRFIFLLFMHLVLLQSFCSAFVLLQ